MPASVPCAIARQHDLGTGPAPSVPMLSTCQQMQVPQNQLPVTCPREKHKQPRQKAHNRRNHDLPPTRCKTTAPRHSAVAKTNWNP